MRFRVLALICLLLLLTLPASAHANLTGASPTTNARLDAAPTEIRLTFTEPLEQSFSSIRVFDLSGEEIMRGGAVDADDPMTMTLAITQELPDDVYTVAWRAVSSADGHTTQGTYSFGVGMAAGSRSVVAINETAQVGMVVARWLDMAATALTLGVAVFALVVWRQGAAQGLPSRDGRFVRLMGAGWVLAGAGLLVGALAQAANVSGGSLMDALSDGSLLRLLQDSAYGHLWLARLGVWVGYGVALYAARTRPVLWSVLFGLSIGLAVLPSLNSHARALSGGETIINDMLHRVTAALWIGGLAGWVTALWPDITMAAKPVGKAVTRFSNLARFYVLVLALGGLFAALQHVPSADALIDTGYGRALMVKGVLFAVMFVLAGVNLLGVERWLKKGSEDAIGVLRLTVSAEMMLGGAIMVMSAVMASTVPSRDVLALRAEAAETTAPQGDPYFGMEIIDEVMMHLEVYPGVAGENEFIVAPYLLENSTPIDDATRVQLRFTHAEQDLGETRLDLIPMGDGTYIASGTNLSLPGEWRVRVTMRRPDAFDTLFDFNVTIPLP